MAPVSELDVVRPPAPTLAVPTAPQLPAAAVEQLPRSELGIPELDED